MSRFVAKKKVKLSEAYNRPVWGNHMGPFEAMRDDLRNGEMRFNHLDATQLVKHAFGLVTEARRKQKRPILVYLYAEPKGWAADAFALHRAEIGRFARAVKGAVVRFVPIRWHDWLDTWAPNGNADVAAHGKRLIQRFEIERRLAKE